jgi:acyl-CoA synthetase (NDP forming)
MSLSIPKEPPVDLSGEAGQRTGIRERRMNPQKGTLEQIEALFHPRSVAVVGVPRGMKMGKLFLMALRDQGFPGAIYPVNPEAHEIDGLKTYPRISAIPGPVDLAILLVPNQRSLPVLQECARHGVRAAVLFTAGFAETGTEQGRALERELAAVARASGMRIIGPNCMGIYAPESGLSFFPELPKEAGPIGMISQSGSLGNILGRLARQKGLRFSKVVSIGNQCDLTASDFMEYLALDPKTGFITAYLEGIRDGRAFLQALKLACRTKPVILWKVGLTPQGARAALSHTGSLGGSREIWEAVVRQAGAVEVNGFEAWVDALMGFSFLGEPTGGRVAIVSGPGGLAVAAAEACGRQGLQLAQLSPSTRERLSKVVPPTGTSLANPVDVGLTASFDMGIYVESARAVAEDPGVDAILVIGMGFSAEANRQYAQAMIRVRRDTGKPFLMVNIPGFDSEMGRPFLDAGVPFFETAERAVKTYRLVRDNSAARRAGES